MFQNKLGIQNYTINTHKTQIAMEKLRSSIAVTGRKRNLGKSESSSKCFILISEDLKSTVNAMATEIKKALEKEIKQSIAKKFKVKKNLFKDKKYLGPKWWRKW